VRVFALSATALGALLLFFGGFTWLGRALAVAVGDVLCVRREHVEAAMARAGVPNPQATARAMYAALGTGVAELLRAAVSRPARAIERVRVPAEVIARFRQEGRGAVIAAAHTANWDLVACEVARHAPLTVVTKRLSVGFLDRLWQGARRRRGVNLIVAGEVVHGAARALREGGLVAMMIDQAPERSRAVVRTTFLGAAAWVDLSPALVAARFRAPLLAAFPVRFPDGSLGVHVGRLHEPPERPSRAWVERTMIELTRSLEDFVLRHPEQWLWMHRRWKDLPASVRGSERAARPNLMMQEIKAAARSAR